MGDAAASTAPRTVKSSGAPADTPASAAVSGGDTPSSYQVHQLRSGKRLGRWPPLAPPAHAAGDGDLDEQEEAVASTAAAAFVSTAAAATGDSVMGSGRKRAAVRLRPKVQEGALAVSPSAAARRARVATPWRGTAPMWAAVPPGSSAPSTAANDGGDDAAHAGAAPVSTFGASLSVAIAGRASAPGSRTAAASRAGIVLAASGEAATDAATATAPLSSALALRPHAASVPTASEAASAAIYASPTPSESAAATESTENSAAASAPALAVLDNSTASGSWATNGDPSGRGDSVAAAVAATAPSSSSDSTAASDGGRAVRKSRRRRRGLGHHAARRGIAHGAPGAGGDTADGSGINSGSGRAPPMTQALGSDAGGVATGRSGSAGSGHGEDDVGSQDGGVAAEVAANAGKYVAMPSGAQGSVVEARGASSAAVPPPRLPSSIAGFHAVAAAADGPVGHNSGRSPVMAAWGAAQAPSVPSSVVGVTADWPRGALSPVPVALAASPQSTVAAAGASLQAPASAVPAGSAVDGDAIEDGFVSGDGGAQLNISVEGGALSPSGSAPAVALQQREGRYYSAVVEQHTADDGEGSGSGTAAAGFSTDAPVMAYTGVGDGPGASPPAASTGSGSGSGSGASRSDEPAAEAVAAVPLPAGGSSPSASASRRGSARDSCTAALSGGSHSGDESIFESPGGLSFGSGGAAAGDRDRAAPNSDDSGTHGGRDMAVDDDGGSDRFYSDGGGGR